MQKRVITLLLALLPFAGFATHLRGGQIRIVSIDGLTCHIEMRLLANTSSEIKAGEGTFDFGDGTTITTDTKDNSASGAEGVGLVIYEFDHTYASAGRYMLKYLESNLNAGILNMSNSVETRFYIESAIELTSTPGIATIFNSLGQPMLEQSLSQQTSNQQNKLFARCFLYCRSYFQRRHEKLS